jgi:hypothetical protein
LTFTIYLYLLFIYFKLLNKKIMNDNLVDKKRKNSSHVSNKKLILEDEEKEVEVIYSLLTVI